MLALVVALAVSLEIAGQPAPSGTIRASSETNGSFGTIWELTISSDDSGLVKVKSWATGKSNERRFRISAAQRNAIRAAAEDARFGELPARLGPPTIPLDGPMNSLELEIGGRVQVVRLDDPPAASGAEVERFRRVWRAIVEMSPIPPPPGEVSGSR